MTLSEFEELRQKPLEEYEEYFDKHAWHTVEICSVKFLCIKLTQKKAGLRDKSIYVLSDGKKMAFLDDKERYELKRQEYLWNSFTKLTPEDRTSLRDYLSILEEKEEIEEALRNEVGKKRDQMYAMRSAPSLLADRHKPEDIGEKTGINPVLSRNPDVF